MVIYLLLYKLPLSSSVNTTIRITLYMRIYRYVFAILVIIKGTYKQSIGILASIVCVLPHCHFTSEDGSDGMMV
jgi:hypothetical protein